MSLLDTTDQTTLRLVAFIAIFATMAGLERLLPKRQLRAAIAKRWLTNLSITVIGSLLIRAMALLSSPLAAIAAAAYGTAHGIGLFNFTTWPLWIEALFSVIVLDFALWLQHLVSHKWSPLWRLHQMHHADVDIDVTTAIRFHPLEIALSMLWKIVWVLAIGASAISVIVFEIILNGCAMFNHANVALPGWLDRILRQVIVTPDMHRVHHSIDRREHDSNYGFNLSIWDRLFRTYCAQPDLGHQDMVIGLKPYQSEAPTRLGWSLLVPFKPLRRED
ncbi:MAG: sterol desaturase family protein [Alphaproteobacteria bacterium]|nr:sterol desaturase family protein [Alphaproteobacteria bacterium]